MTDGPILPAQAAQSPAEHVYAVLTGDLLWTHADPNCRRGFVEYVRVHDFTPQQIRLAWDAYRAGYEKAEGF